MPCESDEPAGRKTRRTGGYEVDEDQVLMIEAEGRVVPQRSLAQVLRLRGPVLGGDEVMSGLEKVRRFGVANKAQPPLADALLIVEGLLLRARRLADSGAPTPAIAAIIDEVEALRRGRG